MKPLFLILTCFVVFSACSNSGGDAQAEDEIRDAAPVMNDSLRAVYSRELSRQKDPLPLTQVREAGKLYPVDQAPKDSLFFLFRKMLIDAVNRKDIFTLMKNVDPGIKYSFGDPEGLAGFIKTWGLTSPEEAQQSEIWKVLDHVLNQGGIFTSSQEFVAPYYFATWPDEVDAFEYLAVIGGGVRLRESGTVNSKILKTISYDIVKSLERSENIDTIGGQGFPWYKVKMADELEGYVFGQFIGSPIGFRAGFRKEHGKQWKLVFLVAGD